MPYLSVVIPSHKRLGLLKWHLRELARQSLVASEFEALVIDDGGHIPIPEAARMENESPYPLRIFSQPQGGPGKARNLGAEQANGEILLFVGDDCIPTRHLLYRHWLRHKQAKGRVSIQGYTDWHPDIPPDSFMQFLVNSGLQCNWPALREKGGGWISRDKEISGWGITTNYSIHKSEFERLGGYDERFPGAAWEDVAFSVTGATMGHKTFFEPDAINLHYHPYTLDKFVARQIFEGKSRLVLSVVHPMMAPNVLDPAGLRDTNRDMLDRAIEDARQLHWNELEEVQEARMKRWHHALRLASLEGIRRGIAERSPVSPIWKAIEHLHIGDAVVQFCNAIGAYDKGEYDYAMMCLEWAERAEADCWPVYCSRGEVMLAAGRKDEARRYFVESFARGANNAWAKARLAEQW